MSEHVRLTDHLGCSSGHISTDQLRDLVLDNANFDILPRSCMYVRIIFCQIIKLKYAEMATAGACFHEPTRFWPGCAYLGHITVGSADLLSQSNAVTAVCRSQSSSKVYAHQCITFHARSIIAQAQQGPHDHQVGLRRR